MWINNRKSVHHDAPHPQVPCRFLPLGYTDRFVSTKVRRVPALTSSKSAYTADADAS